MARRIGWTILVLVVLAAAAVAADVLLRAHAEQLIADGLRTRVTGLHGVDVTIDGTPFITQLLGDELSRVEVSAGSMIAGDLELDDVHAVLTGVDAEGGRVATLDLTASIMPTVLDATSGGALTYTVADGELVATLTTAPLAASIVPHAAGDRIDLEVTSLMLAGVAVAPQDLPLGLGAVFEDLSVPVDLPDGLRLDDVSVAATAVLVSVSGTNVRFEQ